MGRMLLIEGLVKQRYCSIVYVVRFQRPCLLHCGCSWQATRIDEVSSIRCVHKSNLGSLRILSAIEFPRDDILLATSARLVQGVVANK